ncbi:MAG: twin-arginine translocation signal domain-containing protein [Pseudomonadota bacterium]
MADTKTGESRRDFLKLAATAAPLAAIAATTTPASAEPVTPTGETRLQDTEHTRKYFDSARF